MLTIQDAARQLAVTPRTLRHYERIGLVRPARDHVNGYRLYGDADLAVLRVVVVLGRLGVPLDAIRGLLAAPSGALVYSTLTAAATQAGARARANAASVRALSAILTAFRTMTDAMTPGAPPLAALSAAIAATVTTTPERPPLPGGRPAAATAPARLETGEIEGEAAMPETRNQPPAGRLTDVRIIHVPAMPVAASHAVGPGPEGAAWAQLTEFVRATDLLARKPDARAFGFNQPNPPADGGEYGYEVWITIPDDLDVPAPLTRTMLRGGTYAAHTIAMGDFHEWAWLEHWVTTSDTWEYAGTPDDGPHNMFGSLEESVNLPATFAGSGDGEMQLDLLIPVRRKARDS